MSRGLTATVAAEVGKKRIVPIVFVEVTFVTGVVRLWTGMGPITWNSVVWNGIIAASGQCFGGISEITDSVKVEAQGMALTLLGVPKTALQQAMTECRPNNPVNIYLGFADIDTGQILADPYKSWAGRTDVPSATVGSDTCAVTVTVESRMFALQRASNWRFTHEDQQIFHPGDDGFKFVGGLQNAVITWGKGAPVGPQAWVPVPMSKS